MSKVVQLLRITQIAYDELVKSLHLCGDEGLMRIKSDGKHLDVSDLILEVDPGIHLRFPGEDHEPEPPCMTIEDAIEHERNNPTKPIVYRKYRVSVRDFPDSIVVAKNADKAKFYVLKALQEAGYFTGSRHQGSGFQRVQNARRDFLFSCKVKSLGKAEAGETTGVKAGE